MNGTSVFNDIVHDPPIEVFELTRQFNEDKHEDKVNLGVGAYKDNDGKPWVLPVVRTVEQQMASDFTLDHEYLPVLGLPSFTNAAIKLILGAESPAIVQNRATGAQTLSGTGALKLAMDFLKRNGFTNIYFSSPTWGNHLSMGKSIGFNVKTYRYYDSVNKCIDFNGMCEDIENAPLNSVICLHGCAHNPSGLDPSIEQWSQLSNLIKSKQHFVLFDVAYQGFCSGDLDNDAKPVRLFVKEGHELLVAQSFAKNMGLYNERVGNLTIVVNNSAILPKIRSQLTTLVRINYSNPPAHGARIAATILNNKALFDEWKENLKQMASRTNTMRQLLYQKLNILGTPGNWDHIIKTVGLFSFTGLNEQQCKRLINDYHVYLLKDGRINLSAITTNNIDYVANAIYDVVANKSHL